MKDDELFVRVLRGSPTADELAALVAVLTAFGRPEEEHGAAGECARAEWDRPAAGYRSPLSWPGLSEL